MKLLLRRIYPLAAFLSLLLLVGCGSDAKPTDSEGDAGERIEVAHEFGSTVIPKTPTRVITLGLSDQDPVLALGVKPIAISPWYGEYPDHIWPWARKVLADASPKVLNGGARSEDAPPYEEIAGLKPDLILSLYNGTTKEQYTRLSQIAPTVVPAKDFRDFTITWDEAVRVAGKALGRDEKARALIAELTRRYKQISTENPQFQGKTAVVAERFEESNSQTIVRSGNDPRAVFFRQLGFTIPDELAGTRPDKAGEIKVSDENMSALSKDLLVWNVAWDDTIRPSLEKMRSLINLPVTRAGKVIWIEDPIVSGAFSFGTVLSLNYALDELVPELLEKFPAK